MEEMIELLKQIQELAGVGIDALSQAVGGAEGEGGPAGPPEGGPAGPPEGGLAGPPEGGPPPGGGEPGPPPGEKPPA